jgi:hypothetical protein
VGGVEREIRMGIERGGEIKWFTSFNFKQNMTKN